MKEIKITIGQRVYFVERGDTIFERKVIQGENIYSNWAFQDKFGIKEADESWDWKSNLFITREDAIKQIEMNMQKWKKECFNSKEELLQLLYDLTVYTSLNEVRRNKIKEEIKFNFDIDVH
ncbi:hypothetical protein [Bacillus sp. S10(2024)]|uniref:hypothetical protein n=1 Tax=Bacillus sp. S10(2024) TaxID=3162886 RepID=UPI003D2466B7